MESRDFPASCQGKTRGRELSSFALVSVCVCVEETSTPGVKSRRGVLKCGMVEDVGEGFNLPKGHLTVTGIGSASGGTGPDEVHL